MPLTVAVTGPTGEIGLALLAELERSDAVGEVRGMARRPFDPGTEGWEKVSYRRGDILDRGSLAALFDGADVAVHLAFAIFGGREETRRVNLEGSRNVFEAAIAAGVQRLVYASSVAAYGFHPENPLPLTEEIPARGSEGFYYSAQKAELEATLEGILEGSGVDAYVFRPCIVAGPGARMLIEQILDAVRLGDPLPRLRRGLGRLPLPSHPPVEVYAEGGPGNDTLLAQGAAFGAVLEGERGRDRIIGSPGFDIVTPGSGQDTVSALGGGDLIEIGRDGHRDVIDCGGGHDSIAGRFDRVDRLHSCQHQ
jgi:nucleoside-diphosphate-sugar epimerase